MKKIVTLYFCIITFYSVPSFSQTYPLYTATVLDSSSSGYYFLVPISVGAAAAINPTHMILDKNGEVVYCKEFFSGNTGDFKIQQNGLMSYSGSNKYYMMDSTFTVVDSVRCKNGLIFDGHDMQILPNGNFLVMGWENITMDLSSYNMFNNNGTTGSTNAIVRCGVIQEQTPNKVVVFEWHSKDHFAFADVDSTRLTNPNNVDWTHFNGIDLDTDGNILLSSRHFNEITKINRSNGNVIWRLGGKANQFNFTNDGAMFSGQHDVRRIANGNITLWDNGKQGSPFHPGAAKEYQLDEINHTATLVWNYVNDSSQYSSAIGNVQRLANGNTLVNYGMIDSITLFNVVKSSGEKVFELNFTDGLRSYRVFNYDTLPWNLNRPEISCTEISGQYYLDAGSGYAAYKWSNGANTQTIPITAVGNYSVFVPKGTGGFIRSETFNITNVSDPCNSLTISVEISKPKFSIYPNPVTDKIVLNGFSQNIQFEIFNSIGEVILYGKNIEQNNLSFLSSGLYFLKVHAGNEILTTKFIKQ